ncbi:MAG: SOS response-associated peptidase [Actinobacteria bacterium]|nr:SOS response-associated peptidase [Actinomycetota bacterium]
MCGRFVSSNTPDRIASYFGASFDTDPDATAATGVPPLEPIRPLRENYNVAPTNDIYAVVADAHAHPVVRAFHWGLVPSWAKDVKIGSKMINARAETLAEKPAFKSLFRSKRVIVPMDGFYEWKVVPGQKTKQPYFIHRRDGEPLAVAGLWAAWRDKAAGPDAPWLHSCTVITTSANATMAPVHDRMPVLLPPAVWPQWLDPDQHDLEALSALLVPAPDDLLVMHPVSTAVNNVRNKGPELIEMIDLEQVELADS